MSRTRLIGVGLVFCYFPPVACKNCFPNFSFSSCFCHLVLLTPSHFSLSYLYSTSFFILPSRLLHISNAESPIFLQNPFLVPLIFSSFFFFLLFSFSLVFRAQFGFGVFPRRVGSHSPNLSHHSSTSRTRAPRGSGRLRQTVTCKVA